MWRECKTQIHRIQISTWVLKSHFFSFYPKMMYYPHLTSEYYIKPKSHKATNSTLFPPRQNVILRLIYPILPPNTWRWNPCPMGPLPHIPRTTPPALTFAVIWPQFHRWLQLVGQISVSFKVTLCCLLVYFLYDPFTIQHLLLYLSSWWGCLSWW